MPTISTGLAPDFVPETRSQALALELAEALEDTENFACYVYLAQRFKEEHLRRACALALEVPKEHVKKSRGALFVYLVKRMPGV